MSTGQGCLLYLQGSMGVVLELQLGPRGLACAVEARLLTMLCVAGGEQRVRNHCQTVTRALVHWVLTEL